MKGKKKKKNVKDKLKNIINSYKTIIVLSFLINIILLVFSYYMINNNKIYSFSGSDEYIEVKDGLIVLNNDVNLINGNSIKYINGNDYDIKSYKIGYYVMQDNKLIEIISNSMNLETDVKLSELVNNFSSFNIVEKNSEANHFTFKNKRLIKDGLYLVIEAKTNNGESILTKLKLNVTKISKR